MSQARLAVLLHRFGLRENAAAREVQAAYFRRARELHPDGGGRRDAADFIRLKEERDELVALIGRARTGFPAARGSASYRGPRSPAWSPAGGHRPTWEAWPPPGGQPGGGPCAYSSGGSPGAPPARLLVFMGGSSAVGLAFSWLTPEPSFEPVAAPPAAKPAKAASAERLKPCSKEGTRDNYYASRVKKSEPSEMLKRRPHAKQRGSLYISPLHSAAEDGLAEWLHWVGERSRVSLCESLDRQRQTPLHYSARAGQLDACAVLLKYQANPLATDARGRTPLGLAEEAGHAEVVQMLKQGGRGPLASVQFRREPSLRSQNMGIVG